MRHSLRPSEIGRGVLRAAQRPGLAKPVIVPVRLRQQNNPQAKVSEVKFSRTGKTLVGSPQFRASKMRPGLARPLLVAKSDANNAEKQMAKAEGASEAAATMTPKAVEKKAEADAKAAAAAANGAKTVQGWWY